MNTSNKNNWIFSKIFVSISHELSSGGEIGIRARLKIVFRKECGFKSHPEHK